MLHPVKKATDAEIIAAYEEHGSVWKAAAALGMCGQTVHERLVRLGKNGKIRVFTEAETQRLREQYQAHAAAGTLQALADDMGRTKQFICRKAGQLGLTNPERPKDYMRKYQDIPRETAVALFEKWKKSRKTLSAFAKNNGFGPNGLSSLFHYHLGAEYEAAKEQRNRKNWRYTAGRRFEYEVRDHLEGIGAFCMRSAGSKTPVDILAVWKGDALFVQCKASDWHEVNAWNEFIDLAELHGATPIFATKRDGTLKLYLMDQKKDGSRRKLEMAEW